MAELEPGKPVSLEELMVSTLAMTDAKLAIAINDILTVVCSLCWHMLVICGAQHARKRSGMGKLCRI